MSSELPGAWSWDESQLAAAAERAARLAVDHLVGVGDGPVFAPVPTALAERWGTAEWPAEGVAFSVLLDELASDVLRFPFGNGHPRFHGWVNSPPDRAAVLVDLLATAVDPSCAGGNHAALHVERQVVRWLLETVGLPATGGGLLVSGASMATVVALAAARHAGAGFDVRSEGLAGQPPLTVYTSKQAHSCVTRAVELLGLGSRNLRVLEPDADYRLDPTSLDDELRQAAERNERPVAVVASAGTVSTGAIDPLDDIAAVCTAHDVWLHVDGAYGAPAILSRRYRAELIGLARADSIALDPHKWLYVPVDAGVLLVREAERLRAAFSLVPPYLRLEHDPAGVSDAPWLSEYGPEQTRPWRALRVWTALRSTGRDGYRRLIEHDLALADHFVNRVRTDASLELVSASLSIVCFRYRGASDDVQSEIARRIQLSGESFLTTTELRNGVVLRACFINPLTTEADVDALAGLVVEVGDAITGVATTTRRR
ncbi:MAG: aminotransferase class V-fold PLP-dependent enzyme [Actinomycetota bacterium]|nr:aminotransferase class V-fold PLP-dependent enzyme [Actinomycetota bacterium]